MYCQFNEEQIIQEYFGQDYIGVCLEIGSSDGIAGSNSFFFEQKGWKCLCIEPNFDYFEQCSKNRVLSLNYAVGSQNIDNVEFTIVRLNNGNESAISSLSLDDKLFDMHKEYNPQKIKTFVNVRTLDYILENDVENFENIDFISIDTEGTELDVLKGFDIEKWKPKMLLIENNYNDSLIENYLLQFGYKKYKRTGVNDIYIL
jgi:FkbM family methyltransferase